MQSNYQEWSKGVSSLKKRRMMNQRFGYRGQLAPLGLKWRMVIMRKPIRGFIALAVVAALVPAMTVNAASPFKSAIASIGANHASSNSHVVRFGSMSLEKLSIQSPLALLKQSIEDKQDDKGKGKDNDKGNDKGNDKDNSKDKDKGKDKPGNGKGNGKGNGGIDLEQFKKEQEIYNDTGYTLVKLRNACHLS